MSGPPGISTAPLLEQSFTYDPATGIYTFEFRAPYATVASLDLLRHSTFALDPASEQLVIRSVQSDLRQPGNAAVAIDLSDLPFVSVRVIDRRLQLVVEMCMSSGTPEPSSSQVTVIYFNGMSQLGSVRLADLPN
jgi:hypothetical protein